MAATVDLKASFLDSLELRGIPGSDHALYARALHELAVFVQRPPHTWQREDLERFLRLRAPLLAAHEVTSYVAALGIIMELVERLSAQHSAIGLELDADLDTRESPDELPEHTDFLSETIERIVARPRTAPFIPVNHPAGPSAPGGSDKVPEQTDFLAENLHNWREKTGRRPANASPVRTTGAMPISRATSPLTPVPRNDSSPRIPAPNAHAPAPPPADATVASQWAEGGWVELDWHGFVAGPALRNAVESALNTVRTRNGRGILANMRQASVLSQEDADWFAEWLLRAATVGLKRFAIVNPERVISRMQLSRLRHLADASSASLPFGRRVDIAFFDHLHEARDWLSQP